MGITIACDNEQDLCAGFEEENEALFAVIGNLPFDPAANTSVEYYWTAEHENGSWTWHTSFPSRRILLPFEGTYAVQCKVMYIRKGKNRPYAAFWSNRIFVEAVECK